MLPTFGPMELVIVLVIAMMLFGAGKLPSVMKDLGQGLRSMRDVADEADQLADDVNAAAGVPRRRR